jgi:ATP-dependent helicase/nuclease subunit B
MDNNYSLIDFLTNKIIENIRNSKNPIEITKDLVILPNSRLPSLLIKNILKNIKNHKTLNDAVFLPKIVSIDSLDEICEVDHQFMENDEVEMLLANLIGIKDSDLPLNKIVFLAKSLNSIMNTAHLEGVGFDNLEKMLNMDFSEYFKENIEFLKIISNEFPKILAEKQLISFAEYKKNIWQKFKNDILETNKFQKIYMVGVNYHYKEVIDLMDVIAKKRDSMVVFYGCDFNEIGKKISFSHPQFAMHKIFKQLKLNEKNMIKIEDESLLKSSKHRCLLSSMIFNGELDYKNIKLDKNEIQNLNLVEFNTIEAEAIAIAYYVKKNINENKTIAIVSEDFNLKKRITLELAKFNIFVEDSAGSPLNSSNKTSFFIAIIKVIESNFAPIELLSLIKNPFFLMGYDKNEIENIVESLDLYIMRNHTIKLGGIIGIKKSIDYFLQNSFLAHKNDIAIKIESFLNKLESFFNPIMHENTGEKNLINILEMHIDLAKKLSSNLQYFNLCFTENDGVALENLMEKLIKNSKLLYRKTLNSIKEYRFYIEDFLKVEKIRKYEDNVNVSMLGILQANLINVDLVIIASANFDTLPAVNVSNVWLNNAMMGSIGLTPKEEQIGVQALIFSQLFAMKEVLITRSMKINASPTSISFWILKLKSILNSIYSESIISNKTYLENIFNYIFIKDMNIDKYTKPKFVAPYKVFKGEIAATKVEMLLRNPYFYFLDSILKLKPLPEVKNEIEKNTYGIIIHNILEKIFMDFKNGIASFSDKDLVKYIENEIKDIEEIIEIAVFLKPLIFNSVKEVILNAKANEAKYKKVEYLVEVDTKIMIDNLTLKARVDRINIFDDLNIEIVDYKSGSTKVSVDKLNNFAKQLSLIGGILAFNGEWNKNSEFEKIKNSYNIQKLEYLYLPKKINENIEVKNVLEMLGINKNSENKESENIESEIKTFLKQDIIEIVTLINTNYNKENAVYEISDYLKECSEDFLQFARVYEWQNVDDLEVENIIEEDE